MDNNNLKKMREYWNISAATMSRICGFGINQWRDYESGKAEPNKSNGYIIMLVASPYTFRNLLKCLPDFEVERMGVRYKKLLGQADKACSDIDAKVDQYRQQLAKDWIE